jgi:hypothetical protein
MQVAQYGGRIELILERDIKELRGFLKGINTEFEREKDRSCFRPSLRITELLLASKIVRSR